MCRDTTAVITKRFPNYLSTQGVRTCFKILLLIWVYEFFLIGLQYQDVRLALQQDNSLNGGELYGTEMSWFNGNWSFPLFELTYSDGGKSDETQTNKLQTRRKGSHS